MEHNNQITLEQWNNLVQSVQKRACIMDELYIGSESKNNQTRYFCYDNLDRIDIPGFDFVLDNNGKKGTLTVWNGSEQARAPVNIATAKTIAYFFWDDNGSQMAEDIVCDWIMDGNKSIF